MNQDPSPSNRVRPVRWWPALLILFVAVCWYASLWFVTHPSQQAFNIHAAQVIGGAFIALLLWAMLFSRMRWWTRLRIFGVVLCVFGLLAALFRFHGVSGNLLPILEPRWSHQNLPALVSTPTAAPTAADAPPGAADFPQFFGPGRQGFLRGPKLETNWVAFPPKEIWRVPVGPGWSGFAVSGRFAVTQEQRGEEECVVAYDLGTGKPVWSHKDNAHFSNALAGEGPRATPSIDGGRVLAQGATGLLNCLDLATGKVIWSKDVLKENGAGIPGWGQASSPLLMDGLVIVSAGGSKARSLVAYRAADGSPAWSSGTQEGTYSSPVAATLGGVRQVVLFADEIIGADGATGKPLWRFPWPGGHPHIAAPVIAGENDVIVSSGYGTGSARIRIQRDAAGQWSAAQTWRSNRMKAKFTNLILHAGHLYGLDDGVMACLDAGTGAIDWKEGRYGHGQELLVDNYLLVMAESVDVVLLDPEPDKLRELARFTALRDKTWNPPALAGEYFLARNDKEAVCFRLPVRR